MPGAAKNRQPTKRMVIPNLKQTKKKKKSSKSKRNAQPKMRNRNRKNLWFARSVIDPVGYPGAKWPDENALPTVSYQSRNLIDINVGANGTFGLFVAPSLYQGIYTNSVFPNMSSEITWTTSDFPTYGTIHNTYDSYRCVGMELVFYCTQTPLNAQGEITLGQLAQFTNAINSPFSVNTLLAADVHHARIPLARTIQSNLKAFVKPLDHTGRDFKRILTTVAVEGWSGQALFITGATPSSRAGTCEIIANWELTVGRQGLAIGATPPMPDSPGFLAENMNFIRNCSAYSLSAISAVAFSKLSRMAGTPSAYAA